MHNDHTGCDEILRGRPPMPLTKKFVARMLIGDLFEAANLDVSVLFWLRSVDYSHLRAR